MSDDDRDDRDLDMDSDEEGSGMGSGGGQDKRAHHNALERKRRDHIKDSFTGLKDAVPSLQSRQGDKCSRAQILKKASEYIAFMRRKNSSHSSDIEDLKRQNQHLETQIKSLEKAKTTGHFTPAHPILNTSQGLEENEVVDGRSSSGSPQPGQSLLLEGQGGPARKKPKS